MTFFKNSRCIQSDDRRCSKCNHSHKIDGITYECDAVEYDINEKTCFVPKEEDTNGTGTVLHQ